MVQRRELFTDLLRVADHMKAFISHRMGGEKEFHLRLGQSEANLAAAQRTALENLETLRKSEEDKEALWIELTEAKSREEDTGSAE